MKTKLFSAAAIGMLVVLSGCSGGTPTSSQSTSTAEGSASTRLPDDIRSAGKIVFGGELTVPPMLFFKEDGTTKSGINYDLAQAMGKKLGVKTEFKQYAFPGLQPAVTSGKIDAIFDVINDTQEREKQFDFIDYVTSGNTLLLQNGNPDQTKSLSDLCGHSMSTVRGSVQIGLVQKASSKCTSQGRQPITIKQFPSASDARLQVQNGKNTAFIGNTPVLVYLAKTANNGNTFDAVPIKGETSYYGIAVKKTNIKLRKALVWALTKVMDDGTYTKILDKYGLSVIAMDKPKINAAIS